MKKFLIIVLLYAPIILLSLNVAALSQSDTEKMFKTARELNNKALATAVNIFAEKEYEKGTDLLEDAEALLKKSGKPEEIQQYLSSAIDIFNKSIEAARTLSASFSDIMKIRQLAFQAEAYNKASKLWEKGEDNFLSAVEDFNDKDMEGYQKYLKAAETDYKDAELVGIKGKFLNDLSASIALAEDKDLNKYAPETLKKSKQLAQEIESVLNLNRYDTLKAGATLKMAMYELNHGLFLQNLFVKMKENGKTMEDLVLLWEEPLIKIGTEYKIQPSFDKGYEEITSQIISKINDGFKKLDKAQNENQKLSLELDGLKKNIEELNKLVENYKTKCAQLESENLKYKTKELELEKNNQMIDSVAKLFMPTEAEVIRNGDIVIIRLISIAFPANASTIDPKYNELLTKIQKAIQLFPNGTAVIEAHTDGQGDIQKSLDLSQARANAILQYLLSNMGAETNSITAVGLGGTKPIANNLIEEGRIKNRRIEIIINPHFSVTK